MIIRKAKKEDLEQIEKIYREGIFDEVRLQFPKKTKENILKDLDKYKKERLDGFKKGIISKFSYWIVAEEKNKVIAFGQSEINKEDKKKATMEKMYVLKEYRKMGLASKMMNNLLHKLKQAGIKSVSSGIFAKNIPSIKMHEKFGFKITAVRMQKKF